jgi:hypothetical protein
MKTVFESEDKETKFDCQLKKRKIMKWQFPRREKAAGKSPSPALRVRRTEDYRTTAG